jgi:hypothetical protein
MHEIVRSKSGIPPTLSIANGNYIGRMPSQFSMSRTDEQAIALVSPCVSLSTVTGGPCRTIKSHHYIVRNTEGPIAEMLPRDVSTRVRITMVGCMTSAQVAACKTRYELNLPLCQSALRFLSVNNRVYREFTASHHHQASSESTSTRPSVVIDKTIRRLDDDDDIALNIRDDSTYSRFGSTVEEGADQSLESLNLNTSNLLLEPMQKHWTDILVRRSNQYVPSRSWASCVEMFPTLFPAGCGGPTEPRKRYMSVRKWIMRCLRIHGQRFQQHYAFLLLAFDYLATENARATLFLKMHVSTQALRAGMISGADLEAAINYCASASAARAKGRCPGTPPPGVEHVIDVRRGLRMPESAYYGSNHSRMRARHDLFGMLKRFGPMQLFFTVSPDSAGTYCIGIKAGEVSAAAVHHANLVLLPNRAERRAIAARNPAECARYFIHVMDTVIGDLLGWDQKASHPKKRGGVFGIVRAFGAAAETQVAGDLHAHFAIWLHGFPQTSTGMSRAICDGTEFRDRLIDLADTMLTATPPCISRESACPSCYCDNSLQVVLPGVDAFRRPAPGASAPITALCSACGKTFSDKDVINTAINALADRDNVRLVSQTADFVKCRPAQDAESPLSLSLIIRDVQVHFWSHSKSCFKVGDRTEQFLSRTPRLISTECSMAR